MIELVRFLLPRRKPIHFYSLDFIRVSRALETFGNQVKRYIYTFHQALQEKGLELPIDLAINKKKMRLRIERSCLLFKTSERIIEALWELKELGSYARTVAPILPAIEGFTQSSLSLAFDLDHVFLVEYWLSGGRVGSVTGFHADYLGEIEALGQSEKNRLIVMKTRSFLKGITSGYLILDEQWSFEKTFFPLDWNWMQCLTSAFEALKNILPVETRWSKTGELFITGLTGGERVAVEFIIDSRTGKVKSFYPSVSNTRKYAKGGVPCNN